MALPLWRPGTWSRNRNRTAPARDFVGALRRGSVRRDPALGRHRLPVALQAMLRVPGPMRERPAALAGEAALAGDRLFRRRRHVPPSLLAAFGLLFPALSRRLEHRNRTLLADRPSPDESSHAITALGHESSPPAIWSWTSLLLSPPRTSACASRA